MDTVFRMAGKPSAVGLAKKLGLAGVQVTLGRSTDGKTLPLEDADTQAAWRAASREHGIPLDSTYLDMLHTDCLKDNPNAPMWVRKGIEITKRLNAPVLMLVFFGKCQVLQRPELDRAIDAAEGTRAGGRARRRDPRIRKHQLRRGQPLRAGPGQFESLQGLVRRGQLHIQRLRRPGGDPRARPRAHLHVSYQGQGLPG